jgi:predicted amino acid-binding ACT domain protein
MEYTSPFYRIALSLMGRILEQDPRLYADIQMHNPHIATVLETLHANLGDFKKIVQEEDKVAFNESFAMSRAHFGPKATKEASEFFDDLIRLRADLSGVNMVELVVKEDRPGLLLVITGIFAKVSISLTSFHSQKISEGKFRFLIGVDMPKDLPVIKAALDEIREIPGIEIRG